MESSASHVNRPVQGARVGFVFPNRVVFTSPEYVDIAQSAEHAGYGFIWTTDHVAIPGSSKVLIPLVRQVRQTFHQRPLTSSHFHCLHFWRRSPVLSDWGLRLSPSSRGLR